MQCFNSLCNRSSREREPRLALSQFSTTVQRTLVAKNFELSAVGRLEHTQLLRKSPEEEWSTSSGKYFRLQSICFHFNSPNKLIVSSTACGQLCIFTLQFISKTLMLWRFPLIIIGRSQNRLKSYTYTVSIVIKVLAHSLIADILLLRGN